MGATFAVDTKRQVQAKYLARYEIFKQILEVHGNIFECGVHKGQGLMSWANFSAILEPVNHTRKIIGIDTFEGIKELDKKDKGGSNPENKLEGFYPSDKALSELSLGINDFDNNRPIGHIEKVKLLRGKAEDTLPKYLEEHPETICALLSLDFDIYQPSIVALKLLVPKMPKGAIIVWDELCNENWPGETQAFFEYFETKRLRINRFPWTSTLSYSVIE